MHSPWGYYGYLVKETGWTLHYILWKVSALNLRMMMADKPSFKKAAKKEPELSEEELLNSIKGL